MHALRASRAARARAPARKVKLRYRWAIVTPKLQSRKPLGTIACWRSTRGGRCIGAQYMRRNPRARERPTQSCANAGQAQRIGARNARRYARGGGAKHKVAVAPGHHGAENSIAKTKCKLCVLGLNMGRYIGTKYMRRTPHAGVRPQREKYSCANAVPS